MKHFNKILALLAISTAFHNVNAMNICDIDNSQDIKDINYIRPSHDIKEINVLHGENRIKILAQDTAIPEDVASYEEFQIDIPKQRIAQNNQLIIEHLDYQHAQDALLDVGLSFYARLHDIRIETLNANQQYIFAPYYVGVGLKTIDLHNIGVIGKGAFSHNRNITEVTINANNAGLVIDKLAFSYCGTIDVFKIFGDVKYIADNAFTNTHIKKLQIVGQRDENVCMTLFSNRITIDTISWSLNDDLETDMPEEEEDY